MRQILLTIGFLFTLLIAGPASADALADAKAAGFIGERPDGFLGLVDGGAPADVKALVDQVNSKRKSAYGEIAQKNGVSAGDVAKVAAEKVYKSSPSGTFLMDGNGNWRQK